jgi:hypothetical protein
MEKYVAMAAIYTLFWLRRRNLKKKRNKPHTSHKRNDWPPPGAKVDGGTGGV